MFLCLYGSQVWALLFDEVWEAYRFSSGPPQEIIFLLQNCTVTSLENFQLHMHVIDLHKEMIRY